VKAECINSALRDRSPTAITVGVLARELAAFYRLRVEEATGLRIEDKRRAYEQIDRELDEWFAVLQRMKPQGEKKGGKNADQN